MIPELDKSATHWPYVVAGVGFAIWGIAALAYGSVQRGALERALREGRFYEGATWPLQTLTVGGVALGLSAPC